MTKTTHEFLTGSDKHPIGILSYKDRPFYVHTPRNAQLEHLTAAPYTIRSLKEKGKTVLSSKRSGPNFSVTAEDKAEIDALCEQMNDLFEANPVLVNL